MTEDRVDRATTRRDSHSLDRATTEALIAAVLAIAERDHVGDAAPDHLGGTQCDPLSGIPRSAEEGTARAANGNETTLAAREGRRGGSGDCGISTPLILSARPDGPVARLGPLAAKAHPAGSDADALCARLGLAAHPLLREILLSPVDFDGETMVARSGRYITFWPYGTPLDPAYHDAVPWDTAAALLAALHRIPLTHHELREPGVDDPGAADGSTAARVHDRQGSLAGMAIPPVGRPDRVRWALDRLRAAEVVANSAATEVVRRAYSVLPPLEFGCDVASVRPTTLVHGDFHLGQLVRTDAGGGDGLRLIDIDDLGMGDPVWDLARMAGFFAAGIVDSGVWERFLAAYRLAGGIAVPERDEWSVLDVPARAMVVHAAAIGVAKAGVEGRELDEWDVALVDSCRRMATPVS